MRADKKTLRFELRTIEIDGVKHEIIFDKKANANSGASRNARLLNEFTARYSHQQDVTHSVYDRVAERFLDAREVFELIRHIKMGDVR